MYKHVLKERGQIFAEGVLLPGPHVCAAGLKVGRQLGMLACTLTAKNSVAIAAGKTLTVTFQDAGSEGGPYSDHSSHAVTLAGGLRVGPGGVAARIMLPPDARDWIRVRLACDDEAASGALDIFVEYLAR
jgi:hypothetical protein